MLRLTFERQSRRLSQETVAVMARLYQPMISQIESGLLNPTPEQLQRLADVFSVKPPHKLLEHVAILGVSR